MNAAYGVLSDEEKETNMHGFEHNQDNLLIWCRYIIICIAKGGLQDSILSSMEAD